MTTSLSTAGGTEDGAESGKRGAKKWDTFEHHGRLGQLVGFQSQCVSEEGKTYGRDMTMDSIPAAST